jgi:hypothetical protein
LGVTTVSGGRRRGRIVIGENDPSLVRYAGLAVTGELARRLRLVELIDAELQVERRARPVKVRRCGLSPGQLVVAISECQLVGGEFFADLEEVRAHEAGSGLRTVGQTPSAPTALQRAKDFRRVHCQRVERACARVGEHLDRALRRDPAEPVTIDLDATVIEVYGARKQGAARNRLGQLSYAPRPPPKIRAARSTTIATAANKTVQRPTIVQRRSCWSADGRRCELPYLRSTAVPYAVASSRSARSQFATSSPPPSSSEMK